MTSADRSNKLMLRVLDRRQATAAKPESSPFSQRKVRNASNVGYQENWEELPKYLTVNNWVLRGVKPLLLVPPPSPLKGKGDTGGWGSLVKTEEWG